MIGVKQCPVCGRDSVYRSRTCNSFGASAGFLRLLCLPLPGLHPQVFPVPVEAPAIRPGKRSRTGKDVPRASSIKSSPHTILALEH